jgi:hypothetical protein
MPDAVRKTDVYSRARFEDIWKGEDTAYTGTWLIFDEYRHSTTSNPWFSTTSTAFGSTTPPYQAGSPFPNHGKKLTIRMKIDFKRFLPFHMIKYLPAFVQNLQLKVQFSSKGLVVANPGPESLYVRPNAASVLNFDPAANSSWVTNRFVPIGTEFNMWNNPTPVVLASRDTYVAWTAAAIEMSVVDHQILSVVRESFKVRECHSTLHTFSIDRNIYLSLVQRYTESPIIFPIQTLAVSQTNGSFNGVNTHIDFTHQHIPRFVDAIFYFFPMTRKHETCFMNPMLKNIAISMGDFGAYRFLSSDHPEFYENIQNLLNLNNEITGIPGDLMRSYTVNNTTGLGWEPQDDTNYVFGIPTSVDNTFQQGQTSQSICAYTLEADIVAENNSNFYNNAQCVPEMAFLMDSVFAIQVVSGGGVVCRIKELDITTPAD